MLIRGYKIFGPGMVCRGYKYETNNVYLGEVEIGVSGFHFCINAHECLLYYDYNQENIYAEVECEKAYRGVNQLVTNKLKIRRIYTYEQFGKLIKGVAHVKMDPGYKKIVHYEGDVRQEFTYYLDKLFRVERYKNNVLHGKGFIEQNDCRVDFNYNMGYLEGVYIKTTRIGKTICRYRKGMLTGDYRYYDNTGRLKTHITYNDDQIVKIHTIRTFPALYGSTVF